jgi:hypothetical protein
MNALTANMHDAAALRANCRHVCIWLGNAPAHIGTKLLRCKVSGIRPLELFSLEDVQFR